MTYGYASSEADITVSVGPDTWPALTELAARLGYKQTRGKTAGQGSVSAFVRAIADRAKARGVRNAARKLIWIRDYAAVRPPNQQRSDHRLMVGKNLPALHDLARHVDLVSDRGEGKGQGSISALLEALAAAERQDPQDSAKRLKGLVDG